MFWLRRSVLKNLNGIALFLLVSAAAYIPVVYMLMTMSMPQIAKFGPPDDNPPSSIPDTEAWIILFQPIIFLAPLTATILVTKLLDRMPMAWTGLGIHRWMWREIGLGIGIGLGMATVAWVPVALTGSVEVAETIPWNGIAVWTVVLLANAIGEEIVFRGYLFQRIVEMIGPVAGALIVSGGFAAAHLGNPGVSVLAAVNVFLAGLLFTAGLYITGSLWTSMALHGIWNICLAVVFGVPMSGFAYEGSLLRTESAGPAFVTGGAFGPEGGIVTTVVLIVGGGALAYLAKPGFSPYIFSRIFWSVYRQGSRENRRRAGHIASSAREQQP